MNADDDPERRIARVGLRLGWIALALMVLALIVAGAAIMTGRGGGPISGRATTEPMFGGGGTVTEIPSTPTLSPITTATETLPPAAPPNGPPTVSTAAPGATVSVAGVGNERPIACVDNVVSISGVDNTVVLTGHCSRVDVSGVKNTVTIDSADAIVVSGLNNVVTFDSGNPELDNSGVGNTLGQR